MGVSKIEYKGVEYTIETKEIYSPEERIVGIWVRDDGTKVPLYQKRITIPSLPNKTSSSTSHNIENVDFIFLEKAIMVESNGNTSSIPWVWDSEHITIWVNKSVVGIHTGADYTSRKAIVIVKYTKTTDEEVTE